MKIPRGPGGIQTLQEMNGKVRGIITGVQATQVQATQVQATQVQAGASRGQTVSEPGLQREGIRIQLHGKPLSSSPVQGETLGSRKDSLFNKQSFGPKSTGTNMLQTCEMPKLQSLGGPKMVGTVTSMLQTSEVPKLQSLGGPKMLGTVTNMLQTSEMPKLQSLGPKMLGTVTNMLQTDIPNSLGGPNSLGIPKSLGIPMFSGSMTSRSLGIWTTMHKPLRNGSPIFCRFLSGKSLGHPPRLDNDHIRCTIFDANGVMVQHSKDFKRAVFMKMHHLVPRDLRKISRHHTSRGSQSINVDIVPSLMTRSNFILLNLLNVRALIRPDRVVLFENSYSHVHGSRLNESHSYAGFLRDMGARLQTDELPYEFRALEAILVYVIGNLNTEMKVHATVLQNILHGLEHSIDRGKLRYLLIQSKKIAQFHQKSLLIRDLLNDILENDDELNELYVTDAARGHPRRGTNHTEMELFLESYYTTVDEIVQTVDNLRSQIKTTEEIINVILDANRNELMLLGLKFSTGLVSMGAALYVAALYGMNLENFIEEMDGGFEGVSALSVVFLVACLVVAVGSLRRLQKVTMRKRNERASN